MAQLPDISTLSINGALSFEQADESNSNDRDNEEQKLKNYAKALPYSIEPKSKMMEMLDFIILRITECVEAKDFDVGLLQWDEMLAYWTTLKYPIPKDRRIKLTKLYFHATTTPGMPTNLVALCADSFQMLTKSKKKITIEDMRLPWQPIFDILKADLFLTRRQFEYTQLSWCMGYLASHARRFFHPVAIAEMLSTFLPLFDGTNLDSVLAPQYYLLTFLPLSHPQSYLPMLFRMWESINSYMYDERMLHFLSRLAEMHVSPEVSDPRKITQLPDDEKSEGEERPSWSYDEVKDDMIWEGIYKDVGIFTEYEWNFLMCKCLASMEIPLADTGSLPTGSTADNQASFEIGRLPKPNWRISSLSKIIVYSMAADGAPVPASNALTPLFSPLPSGMTTPQTQGSPPNESQAALLGKKTQSTYKTYLAGSRALDSLARMIASTEHFFHPTNSGAWTNDLTAFIKYIVYDFNKRWYEERQSDCKTPMHRRLTKAMKRELVKSLRTVTLLAMFSQDPTTISNIQSCLKSMSIMEPDLILHPILERAGPSLEALVETQRTIAIIKALGAVAPALSSREVYYPGAKYLVPILELLIPGIDLASLNDPLKTLCTTAFLVEISQHIRIGDLTRVDEKSPGLLDVESSTRGDNRASVPSFSLDELDMPNGINGEPRLSSEEEDMQLIDSTGSFPDWVTSFIRRVIQLLENLPDEGPGGSAGGATEVQIIDAVTGACSQICIHLSDPLYDLVLNMVYDYASTNVRPNAVRAIHQLVECVANANPEKTLAKFLPFCLPNIQTELENGASSLRTTSVSSPLPSDATLHWNLAILRGAIYNDGRVLLKYKDDLMSLFNLLHGKTFSKRGYSWSGKLLSSTLLTLTHTYPLENKFVNPDEWDSKEFASNHHRYWGKLYRPDEIQLSWHVPNDEEIDFALEIFRELVEPTLDVLRKLLAPDAIRDDVWRNEFCRHMTFVRNAFAGIPTLMKEPMPEHDISSAQTSDILDEIPEMIASVESVNSGFCLTDFSDPRYQYLAKLKAKFGTLLHDASVSLRQQGEENTVDAVLILVRAIKTYMLDYGDSRDSYSVNSEQYKSEKSIARLYAQQKIWPRAVYVRKARFYHSARLHWNSIERQRGPIEELLIDDLTEWSMWHYATIRRASQTVLESVSGSYDGVRRRTLPVLFNALDPETEDDRMKGALWSLNSSYFSKYAIAEPKLASQLLKSLFGCQHREKPSIQDCVSMVFETCLSNFVEPCFLIYDMETPALDQAAKDLRKLLTQHSSDDPLVKLCRDQRKLRFGARNNQINGIISEILEVANSSRTHWRYAIYAIRCLRTLVRRDDVLSSAQLQYFLDKCCDDHPSIRYYAQRAIMKCSRNIKLRTYCGSLSDLALMRNHNPLKREIMVKPSQELTAKFLRKYREHFDVGSAVQIPLLYDGDPPGWVTWAKSVSLYMPPDSVKSTFRPWEPSSYEALTALRETATDPSFWEQLSSYYSEENHETYIAQDNVSCVKSIFQLLDDEPFEAFRPSAEKMINDSDQNKQRAAAELLAGVIGGSKHWPTSKQEALWDWFRPFIKKVFRQNIKTDTLSIWSSFLEYLFYRTDPRRMQPLVDFIVEEFAALDFNAELTFDVTKILSLFRGFYSELGRKFIAWVDDSVDRCWAEIHTEHDDVRAYIGEILAFSGKINWRPKPSIPSAEVFVRECRTALNSFDVMGMRGEYHKARVLELVDKFSVWRDERLPGVRSFQSTYDRVGISICKWLFQLLHDVHAISAYDYILPLMPELFRFTELHDNPELASRARALMVRMCGVTPPASMVDLILDAIFSAIQNSPSWKVRLKALPLVQVFYFRQVPLISEYKIMEMLEVLCKCLDDEVVEVREMAATTLSGILRLSPRRSVLMLKDWFVRLAKNSHIPDRQDPGYNKAVRQRHAAMLGICALVDSYPYTIEKWMPELLTNVLAEHTYDPIPISTTVRKCAMNFKRTHQDTWHEDSQKFNEDQLAALSTLLTGSSYCQWPD